MAGEHLDGGDLPALQRCLRDWGLIAPGEVVKSAASAGEGNMNLTLRVVTGDRSIVVKQARPWVEKYPSIPAPINRSQVEVAFYEAVADRPAVAAAMPALLASDRQSCTLALEDLGHAGDLTCLYGGRRLGQAQVQGLAGWLSALHGAFAGAPAELLSNRDMRELNHEHIFVLPFAPGNGLDLDGHTPGLNDAASELLSDGAIATRAAEIGERYLADAGARSCTVISSREAGCPQPTEGSGSSTRSSRSSAIRSGTWASSPPISSSQAILGPRWPASSMPTIRALRSTAASWTPRPAPRSCAGCLASPSFR